MEIRSFKIVLSSNPRSYCYTAYINCSINLELTPLAQNYFLTSLLTINLPNNSRASLLNSDSASVVSRDYITFGSTITSFISILLRYLNFISKFLVASSFYLSNTKFKQVKVVARSYYIWSIIASLLNISYGLNIYSLVLSKYILLFA